MTPYKSIDKEIDIVVELFANGLNTLHLNKREMSTRRMKEYIKSIPSAFHNRIVIHSHHELAFQFNLKGIHFTREHLKRTFRNWCLFQKEKLFRKKFIHTRSYRKLSDAFNEEKYQFDYFILNNVFNPITKDFNIGYHPIRINEIHKTGKRFVVKGGVNIDTAIKAKENGFYGICLNSFIWKSNEPIKNFIELVDKLND
ncbi:MAG: thiamine phosphate synthase [Bacteroidia bacterium]